jgi:hypothetical protein
VCVPRQPGPFRDLSNSPRVSTLSDFGLRQQMTFRLISYNIQCGIGLDRVYDPNRMADYLASLAPPPDCVCLQEVDRHDSSEAPTQSTRMGTAHADDHVKIVNQVCLFLSDQMCSSILLVPLCSPSDQSLGWPVSSGHFVVKQKMQLDSSSRKWTRHAPTSADKCGWGVAILTPHPVMATATVRIPAARICGASRPLSQALGVLILHPVFGRTWVFNIHLMADTGGLLRLDCGGSLQMQNMQALLAYGVCSFFFVFF